MRVMLYEPNSTNHTTYDNVKTVIMTDDGKYQLFLEDAEMSQTITYTGTWQNRVIAEKEQVSA